MSIRVDKFNAQRESASVKVDWGNAQREVQRAYVDKANAQRLAYQNVVPYTITNLVVDPINLSNWDYREFISTSNAPSPYTGKQTFFDVPYYKPEIFRMENSNPNVVYQNHIYYYSMDIRVSWVRAGYKAINFWYTTTFYLFSGENGNMGGLIIPSVAGGYIKYSAQKVYVSPNEPMCIRADIDNPMCGTYDWNSSDGPEIQAYMVAPIVIDLTACFGAGNEPTKEWCDANIPFFAGSMVVMKKPN